MSIKRYLPYLAAAAVMVMVSCAVTSRTSEGTGSRQFQFDDSRTVLQDKIFYLLSSLEKSPRLRKELLEDKVLAALYRQKETEISSAAGCPEMPCLARGLMFDAAESRTACRELGALYTRSEAIRSFVKNDLRASGFYRLSDGLSDSALLVEAWKEQAAGLNYIIRAYLENKGLQYAKIDSSSFYVKSPAYLDSVKRIVGDVLAGDKSKALFFRPVLDICLGILKLNGRDEAGRFEPMRRTNEAVYKHIPNTDWNKYPYSAILVFGEGPEDAGVAISVNNKERCARAAALFKAGKAPFIIVSGGYVHPFRTKYCEADQMKRYMTDSLGIAAGRIIMEPHARHTTTNIRNANRIIYRNNIPAAKPVLGVSSPGHIKYIAGDRFEKVCLRDIKYIPFERMKRLSGETVEFYPAMVSLQINAEEPLDP